MGQVMEMEQLVTYVSPLREAHCHNQPEARVLSPKEERQLTQHFLPVVTPKYRSSPKTKHLLVHDSR
jgi:hypothetical protein